MDKPKATRGSRKRPSTCWTTADRPLIVAGGGIINADASDSWWNWPNSLGVPVVPTLMGWGTIPDDHRLVAGMVGLQTATATATRNTCAATS